MPNGSLNKNLEKNASITRAVDIFQFASKKKIRIDEWDYHLSNPPTADDYQHVCRIPINAIQKIKSIFRGNVDTMTIAHAIINRKHASLQQLKEQYCESHVKRLKEPDMICIGSERPECRFIQNTDPETHGETGSSFVWVHPSTYTKEKMLTPEWGKLLYAAEKRKLDYKFVA